MALLERELQPRPKEQFDNKPLIKFSGILINRGVVIIKQNIQAVEMSKQVNLERIILEIL